MQRQVALQSSRSSAFTYPVLTASYFLCFLFAWCGSWRDQSTPFGKLANRVFFGDSDAFRDERLKLIPKASPAEKYAILFCRCWICFFMLLESHELSFTWECCVSRTRNLPCTRYDSMQWVFMLMLTSHAALNLLIAHFLWPVRNREIASPPLAERYF